MPIYEYRCQECGQRFDAWLRSLSSAPPDKCPGCGASAIKRLPSLTAGNLKSAAGVADCGPSGST